jgi:hypothetical protein
MTQHTVKLGGADSNVVVAKVAVSSRILSAVPLHLYLLTVLVCLAWAYDDDLEADTCPG